MSAKWIAAGFAAFGLLVGLVCGLSEAKLTTTVLGLLFALIGGSLGALLGKLDDQSRRITGIALLTFSSCATIGLLGGIKIRINDLLLSSARLQATGANTDGRPATSTAYLKTNEMDLVKFLRLEIERDRMDLPQACEALRTKGLEADAH